MFSTYLNIFSIQKIIIPLQSYMLPNDMPMLIFVLNQIWVLSLEDDRYLKGKIKWCPAEVWPELCRYWCSKEFLAKRKRGQKARLESDDIAQNHGGSRPFAETQQHIVCMCIFFDILLMEAYFFIHSSFNYLLL